MSEPESRFEICWSNLETSDRLDAFLNDFPSVSREHVVAVLDCVVAELVGNSH